MMIMTEIMRTGILKEKRAEYRQAELAKEKEKEEQTHAWSGWGCQPGRCSRRGEVKRLLGFATGAILEVAHQTP